VIPQAGLFSVALSVFVIDSKKELKVSAADQMVYYLRQHSSILSQISQQLSTITPEFSIPSTPPPPFPAFNPSASDVRVNAFWFMAFVFSLLTALLALLVQRWVRNYMHVFQRYSNPLKSARHRQYLYEGCEGWYMPMVAEAVPGLLHVSLFLFFVGLGDSLFNINTTVGTSTIVPICISGLLYIFTTFAPIIHPQSPYENPFSGLIWYLFHMLRSQRYRYRGSDGETKSVSVNMAQGQMQLAMEQTEGRKGRDVRAIQWLIDNLTEDAEMEQFMMAIPGSFDTDWGVEVWKKVSNKTEHKNTDGEQNEPAIGPPTDTNVTDATTLPPVPYPLNIYPHVATTHTNVVHELSTRVARALEICGHRELFANNDLWRRRTRVCIETTASLVCCADAKLAWFGDIVKPLGDIGSFEKTRELSLIGTDQMFVTRWACLSLVVIRQILESKQLVRYHAGKAVELFVESHSTGNDLALAGAQKIDKTFQNATQCLYTLYDALLEAETLTEVKDILHDYGPQLSELENINFEAGHFEDVDRLIFLTQSSIARQIIAQFPGVVDDLDPAQVSFGDFVEFSYDTLKLPFIRPGRTLKSMCCPALTLRNIVDGQRDPGGYEELLKNLEKFRSTPGWRGNEVQRQLWRLQDMRDGGGLGFTVELFFLALKQLLSTSSSSESHSALYTGTFRVITSDWRKHKNSLGTQNLLLDIALSRDYDFNFNYPAYIVDEFLGLLGNVFEGQDGAHIDKTVQLLAHTRYYNPKTFRLRLLKVITRVWARAR
jgi:uncharacterized protein DUF6535